MCVCVCACNRTGPDSPENGFTPSASPPLHPNMVELLTLTPPISFRSFNMWKQSLKKPVKRLWFNMLILINLARQLNNFAFLSSRKPRFHFSFPSF